MQHKFLFDNSTKRMREILVLFIICICNCFCTSRRLIKIYDWFSELIVSKINSFVINAIIEMQLTVC